MSGPDGPQPARAALPRSGPNGEPLQTCRSCGALLYFRRNPATGKYTPVALATGESHYKDCPTPERFSSKSKKGA